MRCYFNFSTENQFLIDEEGVEVANLDHACAQAVQAIHEVTRDGNGNGFDWSDWTLNVTDHSGQILLSVPLQAVVAPEVSSLH